MFEKLSPQSLADQHRLPLYLKSISMMQLSLLDTLEHPAYQYLNGVYKVAIEADELVSQDFIAEYAQEVGNQIFIHEEDYNQLAQVLSTELLKLSRSLSIGNHLKNCIKQTNLLSFQMSHLYRHPFKNSLLTHQFQSTKNLASLLLESPHIIKDLYKDVSKQHHHYIYNQPMQSSIILAGFMKELKIFSDTEFQNMFLASYFKDIGMSYVALEKWNAISLDEFDKDTLKDHAVNSVRILEGRIPLPKRYMNIIENHNYLNNKAFNILSSDKDNSHENDPQLLGVETAIVNAIDIFVAMTNTRPYRSEYSISRGLEFLKILISDEFPQEYKYFVQFIMKFFKK